MEEVDRVTPEQVERLQHLTKLPQLLDIIALSAQQQQQHPPLLSPSQLQPADSDLRCVWLPSPSLFQTSGKLMIEHEEVDTDCAASYRSLLPSAALRL